ncbi:hypothetical protein RIF29_18834 [Crotalaria pallida]|uniref:Uncharacterized protein n=1 Tax=Crotalaria pallida TaxID=3830 RepID=A0AAN9EYA8_CROPI
MASDITDLLGQSLIKANWKPASRNKGNQKLKKVGNLVGGVFAGGDQYCLGGDQQSTFCRVAVYVVELEVYLEDFGAVLEWWGICMVIPSQPLV